MSEPTLHEITQARDVCAQVIAQYGERYMPIFERLENEIEVRQKQQGLLEKAIAIAGKNGSQNSIQSGIQNKGFNIGLTKKFNEHRCVLKENYNCIAHR